MSRVTGNCPICGAKTWDGNTYDGVKCQRIGERIDDDGDPIDIDAGNIMEDEDTDRSPAAARGDDPIGQ